MLEANKSEETVVRKLSVSIPEIPRIGKFGIVGALNTLIDFTIYNVLTTAVHLTLVQANIVSTTLAMMFSFAANKRVVFKMREGSVVQQVVLFFAVTAFGLYVLQTGTIKFLTEVWLLPVSTLIAIAHYLGITGHDQFLIRNSAKAIATIISLSWNYIMYKKVVFS